MIGRKKIGNQIGQQYGPKKKMPEVPPGQGPAPGQGQAGPGWMQSGQLSIDWYFGQGDSSNV